MLYVLRAEKVTVFAAKMVTFSARTTNIYKIWKLRTAIFSVFYNISPPNFAVKMLFVAVVKDLSIDPNLVWYEQIVHCLGFSLYIYLGYHLSRFISTFTRPFP